MKNRLRTEVHRSTTRSRFRWLTAAVLIGLLAVALASCGGANIPPTATPPTSTIAPATPTAGVAQVEVVTLPSTDVTNVDENGNTTVDADALDSVLDGFQAMVGTAPAAGSVTSWQPSSMRSRALRAFPRSNIMASHRSAQYF